MTIIFHVVSLVLTGWNTNSYLWVLKCLRLNVAPIYPLFNQSGPSAGSGLVLVLVQVGLSFLLNSDESHIIQSPCTSQNTQHCYEQLWRLHQLFTGVAPGFACLHWHPNMTGLLTTVQLMSIGKNPFVYSFLNRSEFTELALVNNYNTLVTFLHLQNLGFPWT